MVLFAFFDQLVDIDFSSLNFGILLFHNAGCSVEENSFVFFFAQVFVGGLVTLLDDNLIKFQFDGLPFNDFLLNSIFGDESVHINIFLLPNTMSSIHRLQVNLWIPI